MNLCGVAQSNKTGRILLIKKFYSYEQKNDFFSSCYSCSCDGKRFKHQPQYEQFDAGVGYDIGECGGAGTRVREQFRELL
jgi:hypothetical protein